MDIIKIEPVTVWSNNGLQTFDIIKFLDSPYSFVDGTLNTNYQLLKEVIVTNPDTKETESVSYNFVSCGAYLVPKEEVDKWDSDNQIYDYVIVQLGLVKVK